MIAANGDVVVGEERVRALLNRARTADDYAHGLDDLLGTAWDAELEPYRQAGDGAPITLLHKVVYPAASARRSGPAANVQRDVAVLARGGPERPPAPRPARRGSWPAR